MKFSHCSLFLALTLAATSSISAMTIQMADWKPVYREGIGTLRWQGESSHFAADVTNDGLPDILLNRYHTLVVSSAGFPGDPSVGAFAISEDFVTDFNLIAQSQFFQQSLIVETPSGTFIPFNPGSYSGLKVTPALTLGAVVGGGDFAARPFSPFATTVVCDYTTYSNGFHLPANSRADSQTQGFIGLQRAEGADVRYGWLEPLTGRYTWNETLNTPLPLGAIPEPSLSALALSAFTLLRRRRNR